MSLNSIINTSLSGLFVNQQTLQVASNNIANVNTPGYSRLVVEQAPNVVQGSSAGVIVSGVTRVVDRFLESAFRTSSSNAAEYTAQREFQDRIQGLLGDPNADSSLSQRLSDIYVSIADMSLNPADTLRRQQTLNEMQTFLDNISLIQDEVQNLRNETNQQIAEKTDELNELFNRAYELNPLIAKASAEGNNAGSLEGEMGQVLDKISEFMDITVQQNDEGTYRVTTSSGITVVDNTTKTRLEYEAPGTVDSSSYFDPIELYRLNPNTDEVTSSGRDMNGQIRSGSLRGLMDLRDEQLVNLSTTLGEFSARFTDQMNAVHNQYSAVPAPNSLEGKTTFIDGSQNVNFTGEVTFAVTDSNSQLVASHTVDFDSTAFADYDALVTAVNTGLGGAGTLALTNGQMSLTAASSSNGVVIADNETTPSSLSGRGFSHFFGMNDVISGREQGIYETGLTGSDPHTMTNGETIEFRVLDRNNSEISTVTVTISGTDIDDVIAELNDNTGLGAYVTYALDSKGQLTWTSNNTITDVDIQLISDATEMGSTGVGFTKAFGLDKSYQIDAGHELSVRNELSQDPSLFAVSDFDLTGSVGDVVLTSGDQRGALAFQETETEVFQFGDAGELRAADASLQQYLAQYLGNAGLMAQRSENLEIDNLALRDELELRRSDVSGVNLDEELSSLVVYQNAYNASARVLSTVQSLYDSLLQVV
ncbi:flagellar hook-associated protein FlgK [Temperatibacter marinus]|uniref:Flagellar hook-associated protein 1 n=1 Tax=Temperatibacter marinus TaxID=1456591 RepID=A0AA52EFV8_9PROT|nr:flagellar hook-associated protein FlgK [Temperatibacter marinus]WND02065.1 flagellar hook-associated protein FlgK [Temperatibacter marinus]